MLHIEITLAPCDSGDFNITFDQENPGRTFEKLDKITSLLVPRDIFDVNRSLVEMLEEGGIFIVEDDDAPLDRFTYGFANKVTIHFCDIGKEYEQIFELEAPERVAVADRQDLRIQYENRKFSCDYYLADLYDEDLLMPYLYRIIPWDEPTFKMRDFTEDEIEILREFPNKHYILTKKEHREVFLSLVDILYGYCYDKRTTLDIFSIESSCTINKLSSTLTWFCTFNDLREVIIACYRRALCFPVYRNYDLCNKVQYDLIAVLSRGKNFTIKCMIQMYKLFNSNKDSRYILNQLYIMDYLIFLQKCNDREFQDLAESIDKIKLEKGDLGLELDELEQAVSVFEEEQAEIVENEITLKMADMSLIPGLKPEHEQVQEDNDNKH